MQIVIKGKQFEITPRLHQFIEGKMKRLFRLVDDDTRVEITVTEEQTRSAQDRYTVQIALPLVSHPIRSEASAATVNGAFDVVLDKVIKQLGRQKDRQTTTIRHHTPPIRVLSLSRTGSLSPVEEREQEAEPVGARKGAKRSKVVAHAQPSLAQERNEEIWSRVLEIRRLSTKPMNHEEVIAQMEALNLSFFPFYNEATETVNVMYRLDKGGYGLLLPELE
ncbi:MAG TPA: ribosome-associated translation inhibitor RaiA [Ktedonobacteraceae bacterium]|nr:ribosome-associated translation inhibitor RaiA [Ktedonobacteraceae bacterium]